MSAANVLCRLCHRTAGGKLHNWIDPHTEPALKLSAAKGCQICRLLFLKFRHHASGDLGRRERLRIARLSPDIVWVKGFNDAIIRFEVVGTGTHWRMPTTSALIQNRVWISKDRDSSRYAGIVYPRSGVAGRLRHESPSL